MRATFAKQHLPISLPLAGTLARSSWLLQARQPAAATMLLSGCPAQRTLPAERYTAVTLPALQRFSRARGAKPALAAAACPTAAPTPIARPRHQHRDRCSSLCCAAATMESSSAPSTSTSHCVVNFYHLVDVPAPKEVSWSVSSRMALQPCAWACHRKYAKLEVHALGRASHKVSCGCRQHMCWQQTGAAALSLAVNVHISVAPVVENLVLHASC